MTYEEVHDNKEVLLLHVVSGSRAYGLDTPHSDTDIKGGVLCRNGSSMV
jgi:predicted nucleotidyltransferase